MIVWELNFPLFIASGCVKTHSCMQIVLKSRVLPRDVAAHKMAKLDAKVLKTNVIFLENRTHTAVYSRRSMHMEGGSQSDDVG